MRDYLYIFGYETPNQRKNNARHGWDDEDSQDVFILADTEQKALEWGHVIAASFFRALYHDLDAIWSPEYYAARIETQRNLTKDQMRRIPHVKYGELPDIREMVAQALRDVDNR